MDAYKNWLYNLDEFGIFKLLDFTLGGQGFVKGDRVFNALQDFLEDAPIQSLEKRFTAVATDIMNKEEVLFREGSIFKAMRASIAIPTVFTPVKTENGLLVDGGVLNNLPINHAPRKEGDLLIAVDINAEVPRQVINLNHNPRRKPQHMHYKCKSSKCSYSNCYPFSEKKS